MVVDSFLKNDSYLFYIVRLATCSVFSSPKLYDFAFPSTKAQIPNYSHESRFDVQHFDFVFVFNYKPKLGWVNVHKAKSILLYGRWVGLG